MRAPCVFFFAEGGNGLKGIGRDGVVFRFGLSYGGEKREVALTPAYHRY